MDYRSTIHVAFQEKTFAENTRLRIKIAEAVEKVLEFHALEGGLDVDAHKGDVEITKGWATDVPESELAITWLSEEERINGLIDDLEDRGGAFVRDDDDESPAERDYKMLVAENASNEETLLAKMVRREEFVVRSGESE